MQKATDAKEKLAERMRAVAYVTRYYPNATVDMETDRFVDESIGVDNANGFSFQISTQSFAPNGAIASITPFKKMKKRAKEAEAIRIHGSKAFVLTNKHLELLLNSMDTKKMIHVLDKALRCQANKKAV